VNLRHVELPGGAFFYLSRITVVINNQITVFLHHKALTLIITVHFQGIRECDHFEGITAAHQPPHNIPSVPGRKGEDPGNFYKTHFTSFLPGYAPRPGLFCSESGFYEGGGGLDRAEVAPYILPNIHMIETFCSFHAVNIVVLHGFYYFVHA
jgi:hypothetical protein